MQMLDHAVLRRIVHRTGGGTKDVKNSRPRCPVVILAAIRSFPFYIRICDWSTERSPTAAMGSLWPSCCALAADGGLGSGPNACSRSRPHPRVRGRRGRSAAQTSARYGRLASPRAGPSRANRGGVAGISGGRLCMSSIMRLDLARLEAALVEIASSGPWRLSSQHFERCAARCHHCRRAR